MEPKMISRRRWCTVFVLTAALVASAAASAQPLVKRMVDKHRQSVVYIKVQKTTNTGAVVEAVGTGVIVSAKGHVLTSCHVVDKRLRDESGNVLAVVVDDLSITGSVASKAGQAEPMHLLGCESGDIDVALLKFANTAVTRMPVRVVSEQPELGAELGLMGFPLQTEFYARPGTVSGEDEHDRLLVAMVMNPGDSGGPVFDSTLNVVALGEAGYGGGAGIGIVRPIRHAALSLSRAGVPLFAYNAPLAAVPAADKPEGSNVFYATSLSLPKLFGKLSMSAAPTASPTLKITYPVFQSLAGKDPASSQPELDVTSILARPGYKIQSARFVISDLAGADVVHVGPSSNGSVVRAAIGKSTSTSVKNGATPYVKGFIETVQVRADK